MAERTTRRDGHYHGIQCWRPLNLSSIPLPTLPIRFPVVTDSFTGALEADTASYATVDVFLDV